MNIDTVEKRFLTIPVELRAAGETESRTIEGSAAVFNSITDMGWFKEQISPQAFDDILADESHDVVALVNHNENNIVARRSAGTLKIWKTDKSLMYSFDAPNTTAGNDLLENIKLGNIRGSSFQFEVSESSWIFDDTNPNNDLRTIVKVSRLWDVGPVTFPAYADTDVAKRYKPKRPESYNEIVANARERELNLSNPNN